MSTPPFQGMEKWLTELINDRHVRNWGKIKAFVEGVRSMPDTVDDCSHGDSGMNGVNGNSNNYINSTSPVQSLLLPKSFDVVGDVAILMGIPPMPEGKDASASASTLEPSKDHLEGIGRAIMKRNRAIKIVTVRTSSLSGASCSPAGDDKGTDIIQSGEEDGKDDNDNDDGLIIIAGMKRSPLITTHTERGVKAVINLERAFFSPRMVTERKRVCDDVKDDEHVLVLFCGAGMDVMQIAALTNAKKVVAVESNPAAVECARRGLRLLGRNGSLVGGGTRRRRRQKNGEVLDYGMENDSASTAADATERIVIVEEDAIRFMKDAEYGSFDRIVAARPKEGILDGDLGRRMLSTVNNNDENDANGIIHNTNGKGSGVKYLEAILPLLSNPGGICHWYDFASDSELNPQPTEQQQQYGGAIIQTVQNVANRLGYGIEILDLVKASSSCVAKRQFRVCLDFRVTSIPPLSQLEQSSN